MKMRKLLSFLGVLLLFCVSGWAQYTFKTYAAPKNGRNLYLTGVNNSGRLVGTYYSASHLDNSGVIVFPTGFKTIPISGGTYVTPRSITNHNEVHGWVRQSGRFRAFNRFENQSIQVYDMGGATATQGIGMNDLSVDVGEYRSKDGKFHGFTRTKTKRGPVSARIDYPGADNSLVGGVNNAGVLVGSYWLPSNDSAHGFIFSNGEFSSVDYPGAIQTWLSSISNLGEMIGSYCDYDSACHGFTFYQGAFQRIDVPGALQTYASGINDLGVVVGTYYVEGQNYGFVATPVAKD